jgi:hypothetical protein
MTKTFENSTNGKTAIVNEEKLYRLEDLCKVDLREQVEIMAGVAQELLRGKYDSLFLAAVIAGDEFYLSPHEIYDDHQKEQLKERALRWATDHDADCIVNAMVGWEAPNASERPSEHPHRKEVLFVVARDHFGRFGISQEIHRRSGDVSFGEPEILTSFKSWFDDYPGFDQGVARC